MSGELFLAVWSTAALVWWVTAWRLAATPRLRRCNATPEQRRTLSIFKPLPPLGTCGLEPFARGLESFAAGLDPTCHLLVGAHVADLEVVESFADGLRAKYPGANIQIVLRGENNKIANPKVAGQMVLAPHAKGDLWIWSDGDIVAPAGFLDAARAEFAMDAAGLVTFPYVVRRVPQACAWLETLFVNVELFPGVLLLGRWGRANFGLGAGMLFERGLFQQRVDWPELGSFLADDFQLGQRLGPVRVGAAILETVAGDDAWPEAFRHDLRWSKTVRWNCPGAFLARILVLPVLGWLGAVALSPQNVFAWLGLILMMQADVIAAAAICRAVGCSVRWKDVPVLEGWSLWRTVVWLLCWLPGPVTWSGRAWHSPQSGAPIADTRGDGSH